MSEFQVLRRPAQQPVPVEPEKELTSLFLGDDITDTEKDIISAVFNNQNHQIDVLIPDNIKADDLANHIVACTKVFSRVGRAQRKLIPILGRLFAVLQYRKDVLDLLGCKNFTDFMDSVVPKVFHINRNDGYACLRIAREFPNITVSTFDGLSIAKLKAIARAMPFNNGVISDKQMQVRNQLVESAKSGTYEDLIYRMHDMGLVDKDIAMPSKIVVRTNEQVVSKWKAFMEDPRVHSYVGSSSESAIMDAMISECAATWVAVAQSYE